MQDLANVAMKCGAVSEILLKNAMHFSYSLRLEQFHTDKLAICKFLKLNERQQGKSLMNASHQYPSGLLLFF